MEEESEGERERGEVKGMEVSTFLVREDLHLDFLEISLACSLVEE